MSIFLLTLASLTGWFISSLAGGGSPFILIPAIGFFLGTAAVAPVITIVMLMGNSQRVFIYWRDIDWQLMWWYLPGALTGAVLGAFIFTKIQMEWLSILLALLLITSSISYIVGGSESSFQVRAWYFLPVGFIYAFLSGLLGSSGPILNPLYLNYGLLKEDMIATKSINVLVVHVAKMFTYAAAGALSWPYLLYGLIMGIAAFPGNWLGQIALKQMSEERFRQFVFGFVAFSGMLILWEQRSFLLFW